MSKITQISSKFGPLFTIKTFTTWNSFTKGSLLAYSAMVLGTYTLEIYREGKNNLREYRKSVRDYEKYSSSNSRSVFDEKAPRKPRYKDEYDAIWSQMNGFTHFWNSLFFPWTLISNGIPYIIVYLNPDKEKDS